MSGQVQMRPMLVDDLPTALNTLLATGGRMQMAYAWFRDGQPQVCYLAAPGAGQAFECWSVAVPAEGLPSLAPIAPLLGWYEREIQDLVGIVFRNHPEPHPLVLERGEHTPPLLPGAEGVVTTTAPHALPEVEGEDIQELDFGPVRADVLESAQFRFFYIGERILRYQPRLFLKHRGMERRFQGLTPEAGVVVAERVSATASLAHALAYCQAIEDAADCEPPPRAQAWRCLLAELERIYNHLHYFGHLADATTLKVGQAQGRWLEEQTKQLLARVCGSRLPMNLLTPGGLRRDLLLPDDFAGQLAAIEKETRHYLDMLSDTSSYIDRLQATGVLSQQVAFDKGATGPIERASGLDRDLRRDHPYADYAALVPEIALREAGDALARAEVRADELRQSFALVKGAVDRLGAGEVCHPCAPEPGSFGLGWAESPRGSLFYAVSLDTQAHLAWAKIKSPSYSNWRVFPFTVHDTNMMDYAINEASFGLSVAGCDR